MLFQVARSAWELREIDASLLSIAQFVRAEIVRAWADSCSDPALEELLNTNLLVRWFVDLPFTQPGPDHSTLAAFHAHMTTHAPDALFRDGLSFLARVDPEPPATTPVPNSSSQTPGSQPKSPAPPRAAVNRPPETSAGRKLSANLRPGPDSSGTRASMPSDRMTVAT